MGLVWVLLSSISSFSKIQSLRHGVASLNLILPEHMPVDIKTCANLRMSENAKNGCRVDSCTYK